MQKFNPFDVVIVLFGAIVGFFLIAMPIALMQLNNKADEIILLLEAQNTTQIVEEVQIEEVAVPEEPTPTNFYPLTDKQRKLVFNTIAAECRGENELTCFLVAETIRDRALTREQTVEEVIHAANQFADPYEGKLDKKTKDKINNAIDRAFVNGEYYEEGVHIIHFHDKSVHPYWADDFELIVELDRMLFYD